MIPGRFEKKIYDCSDKKEMSMSWAFQFMFFCIHRKSRKRNEKSQFNLALTVRLGMGIQTPAGRLYCYHCDSFSKLIKNKSGKIVLKWSHFNRIYRCPIRRSLESNLGNFRNKLRDNCV